MKTLAIETNDRGSKPDGHRSGIVRAALGFLALNAATLGLWATVAPQSWFDSFPGLGRHWVALDGPYNHHLTADVGALTLGLLVVTVAAMCSPSQALVRTAGAAWLVSALSHLLYHVGHGGGLAGGDQVASLGGLVLQIVLATICVVAAPSSGVTTTAPSSTP